MDPKEIQKSQKDEIKKIIEDYISKYCAEFHEQPEFIPGKTQIPYSGRVYNEKELINLIDSSLDFWLTAGRFADQFEKEFAEFLSYEKCIQIEK